MRRHLIEDLLVPDEISVEMPAGVVYDAVQSLSTLPDGRPLVDQALIAGTVTTTKTVGEREDDDAPNLSTTTRVSSESSDTDHVSASVGTNTGTREAGGDVDTDEQQCWR